MKLTPAQIIYEDNHLIAVNKPAGVLVQGDDTGDLPLSEAVKQYLKEKYNKPGNVFAGVIHRLDRPVSGVVVLAKTSKALARMNTLFAENKTEKKYLALTDRIPKEIETSLVDHLLKSETENRTKIVKPGTKGAKRAELSYSVLTIHQKSCMLRVVPVTGRPHQIRVQLAGIGCPIVGDTKYGSPSANEDRNICLHAEELSFIHPVKKTRIVLSAPLPKTAYWKQFV